MSPKTSILDTFTLSHAERIMAMRDPDELIGQRGMAPYLRRWILERDDRGAVYIHEILGPDPSPETHNHPWVSSAKVLKGWYEEQRGRPYLDTPGTYVTKLYAGTVKHRRPDDWHRIQRVAPGGCITLFVTGPVLQDGWGFWCPDKGYVPKEEYVDPDNPGAIGAGCGEALNPTPNDARTREGFQ